MTAGDVVGGYSDRNHKHKFNHILTNNPKSVVCGKFKPQGWPEPVEGAEMCSRCAGTYQVNPDSRPLPDTYREGDGPRPLFKPQPDEFLSYRHDSKYAPGNTEWRRDKRQNGNSRP